MSAVDPKRAEDWPPCNRVDGRRPQEQTVVFCECGAELVVYPNGVQPHTCGMWLALHVIGPEKRP